MAGELLTPSEPADDFTFSGSADEGTPAPEVKAPPAEPVPEPEPEPEPEPDESEATKAAKTLAAQRKPKDPQQRKASIQEEINAEIKRRTTARQEAEVEETRLKTLRAEREALERGKAEPATVAPKADGKPRMKAYEDLVGTTYESYADAVEAFHEDSYTWKRDQERAADRERADRDAADAVERTFRERVSTFKADHPDYDEKVNAVTVPDTVGGRQLLQHLRHSEFGPQLAYELAGRLDEIDRIASLSPALVVEALGELKAELKLRMKAAPTGPASSAPPKTKASPPIKPVSGSPVTSDDDGDPDDLSEAAVNAYVTKRRAEIRSRRG